MNIPEYDEAAERARMEAEGFEPDQIDVIISVRRGLWKTTAGARAFAATFNDPKPSCPFLNLVGKLRETVA